MLRRDFVRTVLSISMAPKLLLCQQSTRASPSPLAPASWRPRCRTPNQALISLSPRPLLRLATDGGPDTSAATIRAGYLRTFNDSFADARVLHGSKAEDALEGQN